MGGRGRAVCRFTLERGLELVVFFIEVEFFIRLFLELSLVVQLECVFVIERLERDVILFERVQLLLFHQLFIELVIFKLQQLLLVWWSGYQRDSNTRRPSPRELRGLPWRYRQVSEI